MTFSIRATIRALAAPKHRLSCPGKLWRQGISEVARRGEGCRESGAFLLGRRHGSCGQVEQFAYFDDFDPSCLDSGIIVFDGSWVRTTMGTLSADRTDCVSRPAHAW